MTAHSITWDHSDCEHSDGDDHHCLPSGTVTCTATGLGENYCRAECSNGACGEFLVCEGNGGCDYCADDPSIDAPHDVFCGTPIVEAGECNAVTFLSYDDLWDGVDEYDNGPIRVWWESDHYEWEYADPAPAAAGAS